MAELFLGECPFYIWNDKPKDALESIFYWKECRPKNPIEDLNIDESFSRSLVDALESVGVSDLLISMISSFLVFDPNRQILIDEEGMNIKEKNYTLKNFKDEFIKEWVKKYYETK